MTSTTSQSAALSGARDKYHVYRPLLDLIGHAEGTDRKRGYNETLGYGAFTGGDVDLVTMTLEAIDALQTRMLNRLALERACRSSGLAVRFTLSSIERLMAC